jgi:hypothetical protein
MPTVNFETTGWCVLSIVKAVAGDPLTNYLLSTHNAMLAVQPSRTPYCSAGATILPACPPLLSSLTRAACASVRTQQTSSTIDAVGLRSVLADSPRVGRCCARAREKVSANSVRLRVKLFRARVREKVAAVAVCITHYQIGQNSPAHVACKDRCSGTFQGKND